MRPAVEALAADPAVMDIREMWHALDSSPHYMDVLSKPELEKTGRQGGQLTIG
jgi:hypothetical protein